MPNVYIETYGCSASQSDAEIIAGLLKQADFHIVKDEKSADLMIIVTCYVKSPTEQKILFKIREFQDKKKLIIAGCMPEGIYNKLVEIAPNASLVSTHQIKKIVEASKKTLQGRRVEYLGKSEEVKLCLPRIRKNPIIGIVPISSGCNSACTYCCVRFAKGSLFSFPESMVLEEIKYALKESCKEIWLTAQDTASYGFDRKEKLPQLLNDISKIPDSFFVRVGMMNIKNVLPIASDLIEAFKNKKIYKFIHLPIQSGSDKVLRDMNRGYKISQFEDIVKAFKKSFRCQLWTDIIVGYPTEDEEDFEKSIEVVKKVKFDWINISKFGARPGTEATKLKQLSPRIINERSRIISDIVKEISLERNKDWIKWRGEVLISERGLKSDQWLGRNFAYKPVLINCKENILGKLLNAAVEEITSSYLKGSLTD